MSFFSYFMLIKYFPRTKKRSIFTMLVLTKMRDPFKLLLWGTLEFKFQNQLILKIKIFLKCQVLKFLLSK